MRIVPSSNFSNLLKMLHKPDLHSLRQHGRDRHKRKFRLPDQINLRIDKPMQHQPSLKQTDLRHNDLSQPAPPKPNMMRNNHDALAPIFAPPLNLTPRRPVPSREAREQAERRFSRVAQAEADETDRDNSVDRLLWEPREAVRPVEAESPSQVQSAQRQRRFEDRMAQREVEEKLEREAEEWETAQKEAEEQSAAEKEAEEKAAQKADKKARKEARKEAKRLAEEERLAEKAAAKKARKAAKKEEKRKREESAEATESSDNDRSSPKDRQLESPPVSSQQGRAKKRRKKSKTPPEEPSDNSSDISAASSQQPRSDHESNSKDSEPEVKAHRRSSRENGPPLIESRPRPMSPSRQGNQPPVETTSVYTLNNKQQTLLLKIYGSQKGIELRMLPPDVILERIRNTFRTKSGGIHLELEGLSKFIRESKKRFVSDQGRNEALGQVLEVDERERRLDGREVSVFSAARESVITPNGDALVARGSPIQPFRRTEWMIDGCVRTGVIGSYQAKKDFEVRVRQAEAKDLELRGKLERRLHRSSSQSPVSVQKLDHKPMDKGNRRLQKKTQCLSTWFDEDDRESRS
ncbi:uncharacterized protein BKA78DRAFT_357981 [Phyllosticta capitalensis]|uniref:uncharacterized protein n=1 Tax=Phyllosticta capitalensis TaxID=121624 RepID=UPI00312EEFEA